MVEYVQKNNYWNCPFKTSACCCSKCRCDTDNFKGGHGIPVMPDTPQKVKQIPTIKSSMISGKTLSFKQNHKPISDP